MGKPNTVREIRDRKEKVLLLITKGYSQGDIARELGINRTTVIRDMKNIHQLTDKGLFGLAKVTLPTIYFNCIQGLDEILKECWKINSNLENNPRITQWHKIAALRLAVDITDKKFSMFQNGPTIMQVNTMRDRLEDLRKQALGDNDSSYNAFKRRLSYKDLHPHNPKNNDESNSESDSSSGVNSDLK
jgi:HTH domain